MTRAAVTKVKLRLAHALLTIWVPQLDENNFTRKMVEAIVYKWSTVLLNSTTKSNKKNALNLDLTGHTPPLEASLWAISCLLVAPLVTDASQLN